MNPEQREDVRLITRISSNIPLNSLQEEGLQNPPRLWRITGTSRIAFSEHDPVHIAEFIGVVVPGHPLLPVLMQVSKKNG